MAAGGQCDRETAILGGIEQAEDGGAKSRPHGRVQEQCRVQGLQRGRGFGVDEGCGPQPSSTAAARSV